MRPFLLGLGLLATAPAYAGGTQWVFSNPTTYSYYSGTYYSGYSYSVGYSYSYSTPASDTDTDTDTDSDTDSDTDTDTDTTSGTGDTGGGKEGCNCDQSNTAGSAVGLLGAVALIARRRR